MKAYGTFNELSKKGISVHVLDKKINNAANLQMLREMAPDIIFSARFLHIFKEATLQIPTYGVLNMHPGALPEYRGLHVDMRAMMQQEKDMTMTMHVIDTGIDTGKILGEARVPVNPGISLFMHRIFLHVGGMNMFFQEVMRLAALDKADAKNVYNEEAKLSPPVPSEKVTTESAVSADAKLDADVGAYYTWPEEEEYQKFNEMGLIHCKDSDIAFVESLFDRRLVHGPTIVEDSSGMLEIKDEV